MQRGRRGSSIASAGLSNPCLPFTALPLGNHGSVRVQASARAALDGRHLNKEPAPAQRNAEAGTAGAHLCQQARRIATVPGQGKG